MTSSIDTVWDYMFTKNIYIKLKFGMPDLHAWLYNILYGFQKILKILDFEISYIKILVFKILGEKTVLEKSEIVFKKKTFYSTLAGTFQLHFA